MDDFTAALAGIGDVAPRTGIVSTAVVTGLSTSRDRVVVNSDGGTVTARKLRTYVPSVGDVVLTVSAGGALWVLDSIGPHEASATPGDPTTPSVDPPAGGDQLPASGTMLFTATASATWRVQGGWMTGSTLYQGTGYGYGPHKGLWFYGAAPQTALEGWTITAAEIFVPRRNAGGVIAAQTINLHTHSTVAPGGGEPPVASAGSSVALARGQSAWVDLPASVGQSLVDGTIRGLAIASNPYVVVDGTDSNSSSGAVRLQYQRTL